MKILIEHVIFNPYTGDIWGGTEKSTYLQVAALRLLGHDVTVLAPQDSTLPCERAPVFSSEWGVKNGSKMKMQQWYDYLLSIHERYDAIILNHPLTSQSVLSTKHAPWMKKAAYINHLSTEWYIVGAGGMRMLTNLRWLRYNGGRAFYLSDSNRDRMDWCWNHPKKGLEVRGQCCAGGVKRIGHNQFFELDCFDGKFNQFVFPTNITQPKKPGGYLIVAGRPDVSKRFHYATALAKKLGKRLIACCTAANNGARDTRHLKVLANLKENADLRLDLPHDEIMSLIAGADCVLLPSQKENFSNVVVEAMCHGVPVSHLERQEPLLLYPALSREWGDVEPNRLEDRVAAQQMLQRTYSLEEHGKRLLQLLPTI